MKEYKDVKMYDSQETENLWDRVKNYLIKQLR